MSTKQNPLDEDLYSKTKYCVRLSIDLDVEVPLVPPEENNGLTTGMDSACKRVQQFLFGWWNGTEMVGLIPFLHKHRELLEKVGISVSTPIHPETDVVPEMPHWGEIEGPLFKSLLFHGSGDWSGWQAATLEERVKMALVLQCYSQQPGHPETEEQELEEIEYLEAAEKFLHDTVRDVATALVGKEIYFGKELP